jgi:chemotaxis protein CheX
MSTSYACQLAEIAQTIFATMLGMELIRCEQQADDGSERLLATVQITGQCCSSIVLGLSESAALEAASAMLQMPASDASAADQRDVAAELVNMIGGNLKSLLPGPCFLSLPTVVAGREVELQVAGGALVDDLTFAFGSGLYRLRRYVQE